MAKPTEFDEKQAKRIIRYLRGTPRRGLVYHKLAPGDELQTYVYCEATLSGSYPHIGVAVFLGKPDFMHHINVSAAVVTQCKRVKLAVLSTMHAEIIAITRAIKAARFVTDLRDEMGITQRSPTIIFTDNQPAIHFFTGDQAVTSDMSRHLRRRYDYVRQEIVSGAIILKWVPSKLNCADILTKVLTRELFERHALNLMGHLPTG